MKPFSTIVVAFSFLLLTLPSRADDRPPTVAWDAVNKQANLEPLVKQSLKFLTAAAKGNFADAQRLFNMKDSLRDELQHGHTADLLAAMNLRPPYTIHLVAVNLLTNDDVVLVYILDSADGPVAFRMCLYKFQGTQYIAHMSGTDDWDEIETLLSAVDRLNTPLEITINPAEPSGDPEIVDSTAVPAPAN